MMPQATDMAQGQAAPPSLNDDRVLSRLNKNFRLSKAQQILRLLKDQDDINQRFRHCALLEDEDGDPHGDEDTWSLQEEQRSDEGDSDSSEHEAERRAAKMVSLRKHRNSIDPGRCKTSMGFYNQAEVTEIPYDTDSDNMAGMDSACSTPRGVAASGALVTLPPAKQNLYEQASTNRGGKTTSTTTDSHSTNMQNSRLSMFPFKTGDREVSMKELAVPEERTVQSARSSRPKTSLTSSSSRSRYYRQQPHPESQYNKASKQSQHHHHNNLSQVHHHQQQQQQQHMRGVGETRQSIISRLDPYHPMAVRPFCETRAAQEEVARKGQQLLQSSSQPSTPRGGASNKDNVSQFNHTAVTLYDMTQSFSSDAPSRASLRRAGGGGGSGAQASSITRSTSYRDVEHPRVVPANRPLLSVDSSPIHLGEVSPRGRILAGDSSVSRVPRSTRVKKRVGEMPRGAVSTSMHLISERAHPPMTMMKLPPLESTATKGGNGRDLVCVGKD